MMDAMESREETSSEVNNQLINGIGEIKQITGTGSTNGKPVNEKHQNATKTDICNCPLRCYEKITKEHRESLLKKMLTLHKHSTQNRYLQKYVVIRSIAKRLWEDELIDGKIQRRVTCKYYIPDFKEPTEKCLQTDPTEIIDSIIPMDLTNGEKIQESNGGDYTKTELMMNLNGNSKNFDDTYDMSTSSESDTDMEDGVVENGDRHKKYITAGKTEVCQKAFINIYGITEKRIRYLRERLILKSRFLAERKQKKTEEMERTLSIARNLGAGCQPLFALLEKTNTLHLSEHILAAIENDINLVNNFFRNQLWKPEYINKDGKNLPLMDNNDSQLSLLERLGTKP